MKYRIFNKKIFITEENKILCDGDVITPDELFDIFLEYIEEKGYFSNKLSFAAVMHYYEKYNNSRTCETYFNELEKSNYSKSDLARKHAKNYYMRYANDMFQSYNMFVRKPGSVYEDLSEVFGITYNTDEILKNANPSEIIFDLTDLCDDSDIKSLIEIFYQVNREDYAELLDKFYDCDTCLTDREYNLLILSNKHLNIEDCRLSLEEFERTIEILFGEDMKLIDDFKYYLFSTMDFNDCYYLFTTEFKEKYLYDAINNPDSINKDFIKYLIDAFYIDDEVLKNDAHLHNIVKESVKKLVLVKPKTEE